MLFWLYRHLSEGWNLLAICVCLSQLAVGLVDFVVKALNPLMLKSYI